MNSIKLTSSIFSFKSFLFCCFCLFAFNIHSDEVVVELNDPSYYGDMISTDKGGIIKTKDIRIQAQTFEYLKSDEGHVVKASGDILVVHRGKFYVGKSFEYNFLAKTGEVEDGVCFVEGVFIGGKQIFLNSDGSVEINQAYATTSDAIPPQWMIEANHATINRTYRLEAKGLVLRLYKAPVFWYPKFATNLSKKYKKDPWVTYRLFFENQRLPAKYKQNPMLLARFRILDTQTTKLYIRGEYRFGRGGAGAIEFDYKSPGKNYSLETRNLYGYDTFYNDPNPSIEKQRYRFQGIYKGNSLNKKIETFAEWDVLSDRFMRQDFPTQLFELKTLERTEAFLKARYDPAFTSIYGRVRVNDFRGFKQELPTATIAIKPYTLGPTGIVFENFFRAAYLDYVYAKQLKGQISDFDSSRFQSQQRIYRNFSLGPFQLTPFASFNGIYYGNSPDGKPSGQVIASYGADLHSIWKKDFEKFEHLVEPYVDFYGLTTPTAGINRLYIFSIDDGYFKINQFKFGMKNSFFSMMNPTSPLPVFAFDIYGLSFPGSDTLTKPVGKGYVDARWNLSRLAFKVYLGWNFQENTFDYTNFIAGWTVNEYFAFSTEIRHRGPYDWKKDDHLNYILDMARPLNELRASPISDERTTFLGKCQIQLAPLWTLQVSNHFGKRPADPFYYEIKFDLQTIISNVWRARATYTFSNSKRNQFTFGFSLV